MLVLSRAPAAGLIIAVGVLSAVVTMSAFDAGQDRLEAAHWEKVAHEQSDAMRHLSDADAKLKAACMAPPAQ